MNFLFMAQTDDEDEDEIENDGFDEVDFDE